MKKLLFILLISLFPVCANAQTPTGLRCDGFDTTAFSVTPAMAVLSTCNITTGPYGIVYVVATAEVVCGAANRSQIFIGTGTSPVNGSNFIGSVSSGVLTVTSNIDGFGPAVPSNPKGGGPPFTIQTGQTLSGGGGVPFVGTPITGQLTSTETGGALGGTGTYSIADGSLTEPGGTNLYTLNPLPGGVTAISPNMSQTACNGGFTITTIAGAFVGAPRTQYWLDVAISTSNASVEASWNNNGMTIFTY